MKSFNREFNASYRRLSFWEKLSAELSIIERQVQDREQMTVEDVKVLKAIRREIASSYSRARRAREYHSRELKRLREEYLNADKTIDE